MFNKNEKKEVTVNMGKKISRGNYNFLSRELNYQREEGNITPEQFTNMMEQYEKGDKLNFIKIIVTIGAILIGLGILSFVASNWVYINKTLRVLIILVALGLTVFAAYKIENNYKNTSKALLYLSILIYGSGVFLMYQIFNYSEDVIKGFVLWAVGTYAISLIFNDKILFVFSNALLLIYINGSFRENIISYILIFIISFYIAQRDFNYSKEITFVTNLVSLNFILYLLSYFKVNHFFSVALFFCIGIAMYYIKHDFNFEIFSFQGSIVFGISGLFLTSKNIWKELNFIKNGDVISIIFGILFLVYLLYEIKKGELVALIFVCILILRYYFDTLYDFIPKSMFFIIGGCILLGFGYYFEKLRKRRGETND